MGAKSGIEWTDATWEPVTGCTLVSDGCRNCYAAALAAGRMQHHPSMAGLARRNAGGVAAFTGEVRFNEGWLTQPLRWRKPMTIFVCSRGDLFHDAVPDAWIDRVFAVMALAPQHFFRVLTKRPERMRRYLDPDGDAAGRIVDAALAMGIEPPAGVFEGDDDRGVEGFLRWPLPNVGLGVSVEERPWLLDRAGHLRMTPAAMRFLSVEPLLADLGAVLLDDIDEVIAGGESGAHARPMHPDWARGLRDQCAAADVPFFFKQWGEWLPWEPEHAPCWKSQNGRSEDHHALFPIDFDNQTKWDDGLWAVNDGEGQAAFERVGKKAAGALLDGVEHAQVARQVTAHFERIGRAR